MADIIDDAKKENIILTHILTKYFDDLLSFFANISHFALSLDDLENSLTDLFKETLLKT